ncbi:MULTISPECIES: serine/threonine-protein kinase PknD [Mycobacterium]|uniref:serine/threonine-protein kinase PknD n=1 Tax=Mycobacterium TaxID=1763 RepID=UPI000B26CAFE|nr:MULTISPECIES: serine/threonine-protein kinase PknD [Mycobacterium]MDP7729999.1 serine/threonine-protein kinase PknD [Mycobacterium sp. TY813]
MTGDVEGEVFGRYRLLEVLRWGGIGTVYRARDTMMTREVAIKLMPAEPPYQDRFRQEVAVAARLHNPNIIPIYEAGEIDGRLYLVMPVVDGVDLQTMLHRDGPISPKLAVRVIEQAAAALEAGHGCGLTHGDVRAANIFVVGGEFVYLLDFGATADNSGPGDPGGDIHALTGVLYECLTGRPADPAGHAPKPSDVHFTIPAGFDEVVARGLADDPDNRYQTARELAVAAREALAPVATPVVMAEETDFGRYRLFELLGAGGMGSVYRAHDTLLGRDVAVKVLRTELATEPGYQERFRREAYAAGRLANPHIIPIYEAGEIDGRLYLVMPIVDGVDLHHVLDQAGPMSPQQAVRVVEQVAVALDAAHKSGLVHRDVKPSNLLMVGEEFVYLIDFGLVHEATASRLTRTDIAPGSPAYMAPERFRSGTIADARSDVYSLACVLYECLTGRPPFRGGGVEGLTAAHLFDEPPKPSSSDPAVPAGFDEVIARGMAKHPDERYQSAQELAVAARAALATKPAPPSAVPDALHSTQDARTVPSPSRGRRRALTVGAVAAVVLLIAAVLALTNGFPFRSGTPQTQIVLPFTGLDGPLGVAVDISGNVYVTDTGHNRVLKLPADSTTQTVEPFADLNHPGGIAIDEQGNVVITEPTNNRVLELAPGAGQTVLPLTDLARPAGVALYRRNPDTDRIVVADLGHDRVLALNGAHSAQRELPFTGLDDPAGVAVGSDGGLFVIDSANERILKLPWTASVATVLPYAVGHPDFVAVDAAGDLYVTDSHANRVMKLTKDTTTSITLPFNGLKGPQGVAVDSAGNVYVADAGNNRVLKLPPN